MAILKVEGALGPKLEVRFPGRTVEDVDYLLATGPLESSHFLISLRNQCIASSVGFLGLWSFLLLSLYILHTDTIIQGRSSLKLEK